MVRQARSLSISLMPAERSRWEAITRRRGITNRSDLLRHAMDLLDAEDLALRLAELQEAGERSLAAAGLSRQETLAAVRELIDSPDYDASTSARELVGKVLAGGTFDQLAPRRRKDTVIDQLPVAPTA